MNLLKIDNPYRTFTWAWFSYFFFWLSRRPTYCYQRLTRGWADCDTWNLDYHLAELLAGTLKHLSEVSHGYPANFSRGQGATSENENFEECLKGWKDKLQSLGENFEEYVVCQNSCNFDLGDECRKSVKESCTKLGEIFSNLWD